MYVSAWHIDTWWNGGRPRSALRRWLSAALCVLMVAAGVLYGVEAHASQVLTSEVQEISQDSSTDEAPLGADHNAHPGCLSGAVCSLLAIVRESAITWDANTHLATRGGDTVVPGSRDANPLFRPPKLPNRI